MKHLTKKAKILSKNENKRYTLGFGCPKCDSGYVTVQYTPVDGAELNVGDLIDVKISKLTMTEAGIPTIELLTDEKNAPDWMPDIVKEAEKEGILEPYIPPEPKKEGAYRIKEAIGDPQFRPASAKKDRGNPDFTDKPKPKPNDELIHLYKIEQISDGKEYLAISKEAFETDTLVDMEDFEKIIQVHPMHNFILQHHWWGNGEQYDHYDLFINTEPMTHLVFQKNPLKETEFKAQQREPYSEDFHLKGEKGAEDIPPGAPGNPSRDISAKVERIDTGKIAIYSNDQRLDGGWDVSMEFFGTKLEGRWSMSSSIPRIWTVLKETVKLTGSILGDLGINGDIAGWKETKDGLLVEGTAISFGTWNGMYWSPDVIRAAPLKDFENLIIDVEHDRSKAVGAVTKSAMTGSEIQVQALITDYETIAKIKSGDLKGFSIDATVMGDPLRRMVTQVRQFKRLTVCNNPACRVCFFQNCMT